MDSVRKALAAVVLVLNALASPHFEGYAILMGGIGILEGAFTLMLFVWRVVTGALSQAIG
jgi:hypothetical protein